MKLNGEGTRAKAPCIVNASLVEQCKINPTYINRHTCPDLNSTDLWVEMETYCQQKKVGTDLFQWLFDDVVAWLDSSFFESWDDCMPIANPTTTKNPEHHPKCSQPHSIILFAFYICTRRIIIYGWYSRYIHIFGNVFITNTRQNIWGINHKVEHFSLLLPLTITKL